jgi:hypothetical protein
MRLALAAAGAAAVTGLALLAVPAARADTVIPQVDLRTTLTGPVFEPDDLGASETMYQVRVVNDESATATATGVVIKTTAFECPRGDMVWLHCSPYLSVVKRLGPIAPGADYDDVLLLDLPNNQTDVWFRLATDVTHVDQLNLGPAPGSCINGQHPVGPCAGSTLDLLP